MAEQTPARAAWITGSGMLASALADTLCSHGYAVVLSPHPLLALDDPDRLRAFARQSQPDLVLHTAALTRVNYCQSQPDEALRVNGTGTAHVVQAAREAAATLVYFSTDYVFDGSKDTPWLESDAPRPINAYGASKLAGEQAVLSYEHGHVIRTSGLFGPRADGRAERNFFRVIAEKLLAGLETEVVSDQLTAVTYAPQLAAMVLALLGRGLPRTVHLTCAGHDSWYGWARQAAGLLGVDASRVKPRGTRDGGTVPRPRFSVLGSELPHVVRLAAQYPGPAAIATYYAGESPNWYP